MKTVTKMFLFFPDRVSSDSILEFFVTFIQLNVRPSAVKQPAYLPWWSRPVILVILKGKAGGSQQVQGLLGLQNQFKTSLSNLVGPCSKIKSQKSVGDIYSFVCRTLA